MKTAPAGHDRPARAVFYLFILKHGRLEAAYLSPEASAF